MRISDWSSDVCSSDLSAICSARPRSQARDMLILNARACSSRLMSREMLVALRLEEMADLLMRPSLFMRNIYAHDRQRKQPIVEPRSEEHTSELQSLMRISYAVFSLKKKQNKNIKI